MTNNESDVPLVLSYSKLYNEFKACEEICRDDPPIDNDTASDITDTLHKYGGKWIYNISVSKRNVRTLVLITNENYMYDKFWRNYVRVYPGYVSWLDIVIKVSPSVKNIVYKYYLSNDCCVINPIKMPPIGWTIENHSMHDSAIKDIVETLFTIHKCDTVLSMLPYELMYIVCKYLPLV